jgi:transcription antitermination factor NusA-like protein
LFQQFNTGLLKLAKMKVSQIQIDKEDLCTYGEKFTLKLGGIENNRSFVAINISEEDYNELKQLFFIDIPASKSGQFLQNETYMAYLG